MRKNVKDISVIGGADGPTSVFLLKRNVKLTWKQRFHRFMYKLKRAYIIKRIKAENHTLDEVMEYITNIHGFTELPKDSSKVQEEYRQMRASFLMQYAPELLGEYEDISELKSEAPEDIQAYLEYIQRRTQKAMEVPVEDFDIDFHRFVKVIGDKNHTMDIIIEKRFAYIGGGATGSQKIIKEFNRIFKAVYQYYGVTGEDIEARSPRYEELIRTLSR